MACGIFVATWGIFSYSMWALSCSMCDLVPWSGIEPGPPVLGAQSLSHWTTREVPRFHYFYDWVIFHCSYVYHVFFIHSSVDGYLGCFPILATVNNIAMNTGVHTYFWISVFVFLGKVPRNGIVGTYGSSIFNFLKNLKQFSIVAVPIYIPTNSAGLFPFQRLCS